MDLINRQAAIDAVEKESQVDGAYGYMDTKSIVDLLSDLPSAEPKPSTDIQDVLEYLDDVLHPLISPDNWNVYSDLHDMVSSMLPSAEPEIIRCKDCKYWHREIHNDIEYFNFSSCDLNHYGDGHNFYCADAERKNDE